MDMDGKAPWIRLILRIQRRGRSLRASENYLKQLDHVSQGVQCLASIWSIATKALSLDSWIKTHTPHLFIRYYAQTGLHAFNNKKSSLVHKQSWSYFKLTFCQGPQMPTFWPPSCRNVAAAWVTVGNYVIKSGEILASKWSCYRDLSTTIMTPRKPAEFLKTTSRLQECGQHTSQLRFEAQS